MAEGIAQCRMGNVVEYHDEVTKNDKVVYGYDKMKDHTGQTGRVFSTGHSKIPGTLASNNARYVRVYDSYVPNDSIEYWEFSEGDVVVVRQGKLEFTIHFYNSLTANIDLS